VSELRIQTARVFAPLMKPARYKGAKGGRGSGKSRFFAGLLTEEQIAEPLDAICLREVQKSVEFSVKRELEAAIVEMNAGAYFDVQDKRIIAKRGGVTIFDGMQNFNADNIKSLARFKRAWVEEAHSLSQRSLDILRPTIREEWTNERGEREVSQLWFSWNPDQPTDAVDAFLCGPNPPRDSVIVEANWSDNPWFPQVLRDEMEHDKRAMMVGTEKQRKAAAAKFNWIWGGKYREAGDALVFTNWRVEEFDSQDGALFRFGADWGFAIDPSVLVRCYLVGRKLYVDHEAYQVGCEIDRLPDLFLTVPEAEKWPITADSARPETISYMRRNGFPRIAPAIKGAKSVEDGVAWLQSLEIVVHPRCRHTIDELSTFAYKVDPASGKPVPILEDKNNHVIDALRYACEGARRAARQVPERQHEAPIPMVSHFARR
jgi:phage terminase large subunit